MDYLALTPAFPPGPLFYICFYLVKFLFCVLLRSTLRQILPANRLIHPEAVWLYMIPYWDDLWFFVIVFTTAHAVKKEFASRHINANAGRTYFSGIFLSVVWALVLFAAQLQKNESTAATFDPVIALIVLLTLAGCIGFAVFAYRINACRKILSAKNNVSLQ